ncbi:MAG: acyltransferase [Tatlockia sp.]|nr:acyltransferase [Tatlockia sp.]
MNSIKGNQLEYRPDIDGLRAIAVLLVVAFHAFPQFIKGGFIGVDIFFVISGFLISKIIISGLIENDSFSISKFYSRRINRIFPALILMLIACFIFGWFALMPDEYKQLNKHILGGASFIANLLLWKESGYFDNAALTKPLLHLWSLGIEEQFYIVWPLIIWFTWKKRFNLAFTIVMIATVSFLLNISIVKYDATAAFYSPLTRFWELLTGSFLAFLSLQRGRAGNELIVSPSSKILANSQAVVGILLIFIAVFSIKQGSHFPGWGALLPTIGALLIILAGSKAWINRVVLSNRLFVWFGLISFPLYLWHWPLLSYARIITGDMPSRTIRLIAVFIAIILAWMTFQFIEKPLRSGKNKRFSAIFLLVLMIIVSIISFIAYKKEGLPERAGMAQLEKIYAQFDWKYSTNSRCSRKYPISELDNFSWMFCMANKEEKPTLLLLGNSYANHLYPGIIKNKYFKYESILSIGTCEPKWYDKATLTKAELNTSPCSGMRPLIQQRFINDIIKKSGSIKYAILSGLELDNSEQYIASIKKRIDFLERNKIRVIVFKPHLRLNYDIRGCISRPFKKSAFSCELSLLEYQNLLKNFEPLLHSLTKTNPNVVFFDPNQLFCNSQKCSMIRNGLPLLRDEYNHLSEYGSVELANIFEKWAIENIPEIASSANQNQLQG